MFNFREFLNEGGYHLPVVSISKDKVDLSNDITRDEINRNLSAVMSQQWINPYSALLKVTKLLSMYGITLPKIVLDNEIDDELVIVLNQFGPKIGAKLDGTINTVQNPDEGEFYLIFQYNLSDSGFLECFSSVATEDELNDILDEDEEGQFEDETGDLDPRQK
jgi:hypothetical protein